MGTARSCGDGVCVGMWRFGALIPLLGGEWGGYEGWGDVGGGEGGTEGVWGSVWDGGLRGGRCAEGGGGAGRAVGQTDRHGGGMGWERTAQTPMPPPPHPPVPLSASPCAIYPRL